MKNLEHRLVLYRARKPDAGHAHRLKRRTFRTVPDHEELAILHAGEPPSFQEPADAFFACQPSDACDLVRLCCRHGALARICDAIVPHAQLPCWYSSFDEPGLRELCKTQKQINVLCPCAELPVNPRVRGGESRCGEGILVASVQQAIER